ncbi:MAG: nucleoside monophosphate kinase [Candidatus Aenigmatarchaeota archaeon]
MRLIIFGPPGSGKGTYSSRLKERYGIERIPTGEIFRAAIKEGTSLGKMVENYVKRGEMIPDEIVIEVVKNLIGDKNNFILDGFPRTIKQAEALGEMVKIDGIILINCHEEILVEKICARRICSNPNCDGNYNIADIKRVIDGVEYILPPLLPKSDMVCDKCGSKLIQRDDDKPEIVKKRIMIYKQQTLPLIDYYKKAKVPFIEVWMNRPADEIVSEIISRLEKLNLI